MRVSIAIALVFLVAAPASARAAGWRVAFEDSFDGPELDGRKWATRYVQQNGTLDRINDELEHYRDDHNHEIHDGILSLVAHARHAASSVQYDSGMVRSRQTFYYGYFEARVFLPSARGIWPAFWLNSDYDSDGQLGWPPEIDAFEYVINEGTEKADMIHSGVVVGRLPERGGDWLFRDDAFNQRWTFFKAPAPLNQSWHVVGLLWKPDSVTMYLDGRKLYTRSYRWLSNDGNLAPPAHVLLNLAIGGNWAGHNGVNEAAFPQELKVDYVRVCQFSETIPGPDRCGDSALAPTATEGQYHADVDDMPRTTLLSASVARAAARAGDEVLVHYRLSAVKTKEDHRLHILLVNEAGREVSRVSDDPPEPTSRWHRTVDVTQVLAIPADASPGNYAIMFAVGSRKPGHPDQFVPMNAAPEFGVSDGRLRYTVSHLAITR